MSELLKLKEELGKLLYGERKDVLKLRDVSLFEKTLEVLSREAERSRVEEEALSFLERILRLRSMSDSEVEAVAEKLAKNLFEFFEREGLFFSVDVEFFGPHSLLRLPLTEEDRRFYRVRLKAFDFCLSTVRLKVEQSFEDLINTYSESRRAGLALDLFSKSLREAERAFGEAFSLFRSRETVAFGFFLKRIGMGLDGLLFPDGRRSFVSSSEVSAWVSLSDILRRPSFQREFGVFLAPWLMDGVRRKTRLSLGRDPKRDWALIFLFSKKTKSIEEVRRAVSAVADEVGFEGILRALESNEAVFRQVAKAFPSEAWRFLQGKRRLRGARVL